MNGHAPYTYLKDVLMRRASRIEEGLPHRWQASNKRTPPIANARKIDRIADARLEHWF